MGGLFVAVIALIGIIGLSGVFQGNSQLSPAVVKAATNNSETTTTCGCGAKAACGGSCAKGSCGCGQGCSMNN